MNNIIYNDNEIIGRYSDLEKYFREELKRQSDDWGIEPNEILENTKDMMEILIKIGQSKHVEDDGIFRITRHAMGGYVFKVLKEEEE